MAAPEHAAFSEHQLLVLAFKSAHQIIKRVVHEHGIPTYEYAPDQPADLANVVAAKVMAGHRAHDPSGAHPSAVEVVEETIVLAMRAGFLYARFLRSSLHEGRAGLPPLSAGRMRQWVELENPEVNGFGSRGATRT